MGFDVVMIFTKEQLLDLLTDMRGAVHENDSFEGSVRYMIPDSGVGDFEVEAAYRVGNSEGQGSLILISATAPEKPPAAPPQWRDRFPTAAEVTAHNGLWIVRGSDSETKITSFYVDKSRGESGLIWNNWEVREPHAMGLQCWPCDPDGNRVQWPAPPMAVSPEELAKHDADEPTF